MRLLIFERGVREESLQAGASLGREAQSEEVQPEEMQVDIYAFEALEALLAYDPQEPERWLTQVYDYARLRHLPANWLSQVSLRPPEHRYDPAQVLHKLGRIWGALPAAVWHSVREQQLQQASRVLHAGAGVQSEAGALNALLLSRRVARETLLPALVGAQATPLSGWRLPHHWHAAFALSAPRTVALLDQLYGFGGPDESARVLRAMRGLGMLAAEQQARVTVQAGYHNGMVRLVRDETAKLHRADIQRWAQLSPARRERLSVLLGLERSPLGAAALDTAQELVQAVQREAGSMPLV